jgi:hypothetical protein
MDNKVRYRIHGILYKPLPGDQIQKGDLVFDTKDNTYGYCDGVKGDKIAIKDNFVVEVGVPKSRCYKLTPSTDNNSEN